MMALNPLLLALLLLLPISHASAGCNINITARNSGHETVFINPFEAKVKIKMGTWKKIFTSVSSPTELAIAPGGRFSYVYKAFFGCGKKRRYKFVIRSYNESSKVSCPHSFYIPGATSFTTSTDIDLGDLVRFGCTDTRSGGGKPSQGGYGGERVSSSGQAGGAMCNLSGSWRLRNIRNNDVSPLIWKVRFLTNEGSANRRNYDVTRYKDDRRFSPPASGRLYQSASEVLLFYNTPASMPRYNVSRIMSLRRLSIQPGCNAMKQLQIFSSLYGTRAGTNMIFERLQSGGDNPVVSNPVGKPVTKGRQPIWQQNWKPSIPDDRKEEIERHERLRGR